MKLKYGKEEVQLPIQDKNIIKILNPEKQEVLLNPENKLKELLKNPIGCSSLRELIFQKKASKILIIVNYIWSSPDNTDTQLSDHGHSFVFLRTMIP